MPYHSILFPSPAQEAQAKRCPWLALCVRRPGKDALFETRGNKTFPVSKHHLTNLPRIPALFADTGLDTVLDIVLPDADDALHGVYYALATDAATVRYRQEILRALEDADTADHILSFCRAVEGAARTIADGQTVHHASQSDKYAVDGAVAYCDAIRTLLAGAHRQPLPAEGLASFVRAVRAYADTPAYRQTEALLHKTQAAVEAISFSLKIRKGKVLVCPGDTSGDLIRETRDDLIPLQDTPAQNPPQPIRLFGELAFGPLGNLIAGALEKQHPEPFALLHTAAAQAQAIIEPFIRTFAREIRFYTSYLDVVRTLRESGLPVTYPAIADDDTVCIDGAYDMGLALQPVSVVPSDCRLSTAERGIIITGANHSGKTTYLRAIGQIAALTALGLPVPCAAAKLPVFTGFFSHFSDAEEGDARQGRLKEELVKLKPILQSAGAGSLVLLNEMFSSTTVQDAQTMADRMIGGLAAKGARVLCVTHTAGDIPPRFVSMVAQVAPGSHERLYTVVRAPAETHAHVDALIAKYRLTYTQVKERIAHDV